MLTLTLLVVTMSGGMPSARLLDAPLVAEVAPPLVPSTVAPSDAQVSAAQLQVDLEALKRERPSLGAPITLLAVGGSFGLLGAVYLITSAGFGPVLGAVSPLLVLGIIGVGAGVPMLVIGTWLLINRVGERSRIDAEMTRLKGQLQQRRQEERLAPPQQQQMDEPPPQVQGPSPTLRLAQF